MNNMLIGSNNPGKVAEMQSLLADLPIQLLIPADLNLSLKVEETGSSYAENAAIKARAYSAAAGLLTLADDSGLEVDALGGAPGVYSARYAPEPGATDADRRRYLLKRLKLFPRPWQAHFHCTIALAIPQGGVFSVIGECPGEIIPEERGQGGFGYDPIFYLPEYKCTMAELSAAQKNRLSHRARAVIAARPILLKLLGEMAGKAD